MYLGKKTLEQFETLVLHALGNATAISVNAAEKLVRNGYAEYVSLETKTIEVEEARRGRGRPEAENGQPPRQVKRAKLLITLKRASNFREVIEKFNSVNQENEKYITDERNTRGEKKPVKKTQA